MVIKGGEETPTPDVRTNTIRDMLDKTLEKIKTSVSMPTQSLSEEQEGTVSGSSSEEFIVEHSLEELKCIDDDCIEVKYVNDVLMDDVSGNYRELILRDLGVRYLDEKFTRPRHSDDETDIMILKEAGISYINENEWEELAFRLQT